MQSAVAHISDEEFLAVVAAESCRSIINEGEQATSPAYVRYESSAQKLLGTRVFPPWRTSRDGALYVGDYRVSRTHASAVSFSNLARKTHLFDSIGFDPEKNYLLTNRLVAFRCLTCGVVLLKDGNHRLLQCAFHGLDPELLIYEVRSTDWHASTIDMKNVCECITHNVVEDGGCGAMRTTG
jgi:hypothetical protein